MNGQPAIVDVAAVVTSMEDVLRRVAGADVDLRIAPASALPVRAGRQQIERLLTGLVAHARDTMPRGGGLLLATSQVLVGPAEESHGPGVEPGQYVCVEVSYGGRAQAVEADTPSSRVRVNPAEAGSHEGVGSHDEAGAHEGSGFNGSSASWQALVTECGGYLTSAPAGDAGAAVRVLLPRADVRARRGFGSLPRGTETVLLVEDEHGVRELIRAFLTRCGYSVIDTPEVAEAIALFGGRADEISLLITDVVMPQMNGRVLAERLVAIKPDLRVLYMSGYTDDQVLVQEIAGGAGFLQKPFTPDVLARKVREVLDAPRHPGRGGHPG